MSNIALYLTMIFIVPIALFTAGYWVSLLISDILSDVFGGGMNE